MKRCRFLSVLLVVVMAIGMVPSAAFAADTDTSAEETAETTTTTDESFDNPPEVPDVIEYDGITYYDAGSTHFDDSEIFIEDLLEADTDYLDGHNPAELWQYLAYAIQDRYGSDTDDDKFKTDFDNAIHQGTALDINLMSDGSSTYRGRDDEYNVNYTGLDYAGSLQEAGEEIEDHIFSWYRSAGGGREDQYGGDNNAAVAQNNTLLQATSSQDVYYMLTGAFKTSGTNKKGHYQALGIIFSDFAITPVFPSDESYYPTQRSTNKDLTAVESNSNLRNDTNTTATMSQTVTNNVTTTATSTINGSNGYSLNETVSAGVNVKVVNASVNVNFGQTFSSGWSEQNSTATSDSQANTITVTLPPYTFAAINQYDSTTTSTTNYNCPCALTYNVTIVEYTLDPSSNNAKCSTQILTTFTNTATSDLHRRGVINKDHVGQDDLNFTQLYSDHSDLEAYVEDLSVCMPMSGAGATFTVTEDSFSNELGSLMPIYPLNAVALTYPMTQMTLLPGQEYNLRTIELTGTNRYLGAYFGFSKILGHWILVDEEGNDITDTTNVASIDADPISGHQILTAGNESGTVYVKYMIDEDCYTSETTQGTFTTNEDLAGTASVKFVVTGTDDSLEAGHIEVTGELTGIVGDEPAAIDGPLTAVVYDATDKQVDKPVSWEAREVSGITVENNAVSFSAPGTYHIRAVCGNVRSEWVEVTAEERSLDSVVIPESREIALNDNPGLNLDNIQVLTYDQFGDLFDTDSEVSWNVSGGASIDGGYAIFPDAGTYTLTAEVGGITSNEMTVTVLGEEESALDWGYDNDITDSETLAGFDGNSSCTRAQAVTFLWRMAGCPEVSDTDLPFTDVNESDWYSQAVAWAAENGITNGTGENTFSPDKTCSRAEIVTLIWNMKGKPGAVNSGKFEDVASDAWYADAVDWIQSMDIVNGTGEATFSPNADCTRSQILIMLYRFHRIYSA